MFMFSIQMASTGPSKIIHLRSGVESRAALRNSTARTPSVHSLEVGSSAPYNCPMVTALGFRMYVFTCCSLFRPCTQRTELVSDKMKPFISNCDHTQVTQVNQPSHTDWCCAGQADLWLMFPEGIPLSAGLIGQQQALCELQSSCHKTGRPA